MAIDLSSVEVPRHVHKPGGVSQIVRTLADLKAAVDDGWLIDPNAPVEHALSDHSGLVDVEPLVYVDGAIKAVAVDEPAEEVTPNTPAPKKRGRPRKGA